MFWYEQNLVFFLRKKLFTRDPLLDLDEACIWVREDFAVEIFLDKIPNIG